MDNRWVVIGDELFRLSHISHISQEEASDNFSGYDYITSVTLTNGVKISFPTRERLDLNALADLFGDA